MKMNLPDRTPILRKYGITLYGRVVNNSGKLGKYTVYAHFNQSNGIEYATFAEAETYFNYLVKQVENSKPIHQQ